MPIIKAAKKAMRSSNRRRQQNSGIKDKLKKAIKNTSNKNLSEVFSVIDKASKNHILHKNKAARLKSRLSKKFPQAPIKKVAAKRTKKNILKK